MNVPWEKGGFFFVVGHKGREEYYNKKKGKKRGVNEL